jgi:nucleoid DNA-binding protein
MTAVSISIERAGDELADIQKEMYRLERRMEAVQETVRRAAEERSVSEQRAFSSPVASIRIARYQLRGHPLKANPELSARVQQSLNLETKKEAEIAVGAVVDALEQTLLNNLGIDGFSLKLGGFGKFKVRHTKPITRRVGFSGETVITKRRRRIRFVSLGMLRASETG